MSQPILIIDDDEDSRSVIRLVLEMDGYEVLTASDGAEGLELARTRRPALILSDLMMPMMDAFGFREAQLDDPKIAGIPILLVTGHPQAKLFARQIGAADCLGKPVHFGDLLGSVQAIAGVAPP